MTEPKYHLTAVVNNKEDSPEDFNGPLDVILLLLSKHKIEIQDISITSILEQYLAYLEEMRQLDMEIASEFIAMASHLMMIKTKMLLSYGEQQEAISEMELLIRSLEERQRKEAYTHIQSAFGFLEAGYNIGSLLSVKGQEPYQKDGTYQYVHDKNDLLIAMAAMVDRSEEFIPPPTANFVGIVGAEPYPIVMKASQILRRLMKRGTMAFKGLFRGCTSRSEVVATFLAVLELCKLKSVSVDTDSPDMEVTYLEMPEENILKSEF